VVLYGETGTGKELAAAALHEWSERRAGPFVALNCAALPETLVESELFGYERGAFTGAAAAKRGLLESGAGGTVLLDEIGELSPAVQAKLLRVLESKTIQRLGEVRARPVDIRVVAATNRRLDDEVTAGRFRADLFFRLGAASISLPPLRERPDDFPMLAHALLAAACVREERAKLAVSPEAMRLLAAHSWPGNVRELKNLADYFAATILEPVIVPRHLPRQIREARAPTLVAAEQAPSLRRVDEELRELERSRLEAALDATAGNQTQAAKLIGMPLRTFVYKLKKHELGGKRRRE
jgi:DNA-binding NtrC family response regulator